jgi:hypothetical protein
MKSDKNDAMVHHGKVSKVQRYGWADASQVGRLEWVPKDRINVDQTYQRDSKSHRAVKIASEFSWPCFGTLLLARRKDGSLFVVDGQHRLMAAMRRADIVAVPCIIFDSSDVKEEATVFVKANTMSKMVEAADKHRSLVRAEDTVAVELQAMVADAGRTVRVDSGPGTVACIRKMRGLYTSDRGAMVRAWPTIVEVCKGHPLHERILGAIHYLEHHNGHGHRPSDPRWRKRLVAVGYCELLQRINAAAGYHGKGGDRIHAEGVRNAVNRQLSDAARMVTPEAVRCGS